jgi:hypothetical protein
MKTPDGSTVTNVNPFYFIQVGERLVWPEDISIKSTEAQALRALKDYPQVRVVSCSMVMPQTAPEKKPKTQTALGKIESKDFAQPILQIPRFPESNFSFTIARGGGLFQSDQGVKPCRNRLNRLDLVKFSNKSS